MDEQRRVAAFIEAYDLEIEPEYRILDLASEVGEISKETIESTNYGKSPERATVASDELGDALFSLLALAESLEIDVGEALDEALAKYERRLEETGSSGSGE